MTRLIVFLLIILSSLFAACDPGDPAAVKAVSFDSSYRYPVEDFRELCTKLENKAISKNDLLRRFRGPFDSRSQGDTSAFTFILLQTPESLDTCWGQVYYNERLEKVVGDGMICQ